MPKSGGRMLTSSHQGAMSKPVVSNVQPATQEQSSDSIPQHSEPRSHSQQLHPPPPPLPLLRGVSFGAWYGCDRPPMPNKQHLEELFVRLQGQFPQARHFERAKSAYQCVPCVVKVAKLSDVRTVKSVVCRRGRKRCVLIVAPLHGQNAGDGGDSGATFGNGGERCIKMIQDTSESAQASSQLYEEFLLHMKVTQHQLEQRPCIDQHLIAACKGVWFELDSAVGYELDYYPDGTLANLDYTVEDDERFRLLRDAVQGLKFLYSLNIIHFDVKLSNFCVGRRKDGSRIAKVIDLGSAKFVGQRLNRLGGLDDTRRYRPPELYPADNEVDRMSHPRSRPTQLCTVSVLSDSWRFGHVVFEVLTMRAGALWENAHRSDTEYLAFVHANHRKPEPVSVRPQRQAKLVFPDVYTRELPACADLLIANLLCPEPRYRLTFTEIIQEISKHLDSSERATQTQAEAASAPAAASGDGCPHALPERPPARHKHAESTGANTTSTQQEQSQTCPRFDDVSANCCWRRRRGQQRPAPGEHEIREPSVAEPSPARTPREDAVGCLGPFRFRG